MTISIKIPKNNQILYIILISLINLFCFTVSNALSQETQINLTIPYTELKPSIDGVITPGEWTGSQQLYLTNETEPSQNVPAIVDTEVFLMEDGANFYLAFIASDPEPDKIRAFFSDRDACFDHDLVGVVIDTFNDERRAFEFMSNPFGVQMDRIFNEMGGGMGPPGGGMMDNSWNAIWDSVGKITDKGYVVEMKIPLNQLRFPAGLDKQTWGIDLVRFYPRNKRHKFSINIKNYDLACNLCQLTKVEGFKKLEQGMNLRIVPALTASYSKNRPSPITDSWDSSSRLDAGVDVRWGINQDSYLNATVNPDFSQVEADVAQLNVNNTYALFFPERREFFLEGADYFKTFVNLVHSRNIISPDYGVKLTGKRDVHTYGLFFTNDENTNFIIPGNQGSIPVSLSDTESRNTVFRYRSDVARNANLGVILTDRHGDNYSNTVAGIDGNIRIGQSNNIQVQAMKSYSEYPEIIQMLYGQKEKLDDFAYMIDYSHDDNNWLWGGRYAEYGDDFRADMGFLNRVDYKETSLFGGHNWNFGPDKSFSRFHIGGNWWRSLDEEGNKLENKFEILLNAQGPMQSFFFLIYNQGENFYNGISFDERTISLFGSIRPLASIEVALDTSYGDKIDYYNTRLGEVLSIAPHVDLQLGKHFQARLQHTYEQMEIDGERLYSTNLSDLRFTYQFTIRSFIRIIVQYSDTKRNMPLYLPLYYGLLDERYKDMTTQFLYSYKINHQTRFFIGYSDTGYQNDLMGKIQNTNRSFFTKLSYGW